MRVSAHALVFSSVGMILATATAAFAQDPNAYPPQQYPQQQYPQQQYPQQQYPQQPQQYPQQYPPAGYAAPAPAAPPSYQQPGYAPAPVPANTDLRHGGLMILNMGLNVPVGDGSENYSAGFSLGGLFGGHLTRDISLNGELSINILNPDNASSDVTVGIVHLAFSPLFHFGQGNIEFVAGPKLGAYSHSVTVSDSDYEETMTGVVYGINAGAFFQLSPSLSLGGLLNYSGHSPSKYCTNETGVKECYTSNLGDNYHLMTISGAVRW